MKNFSIKTKLILIFILIKIIPLLLVSYIAYEGVLKLDKYLNDNTTSLFAQSKKIILNTADKSIEDSIKNLDKKSQLALERLSLEVANNIAQFLYQRDEDVLFLSKLQLSQEVLESFYNTKKRDIIIHGDYEFNDETKSWELKEKTQIKEQRELKAKLKDNSREFNFTDPLNLKTKKIPLYKEVSFFNLEGKEFYKVSSIDENLLDISLKKNTYIGVENYFKEIESLKNGEIYVSNVIGEYIPSKVIGNLTKEKTKKLGVDFDPTKFAYAGKENPLGKKFEGIIRFVTPVYKNGEKVGYVSLALDHEHIMQFSDTLNPTSNNAKQDIADASVGNYAFMWDYKGRSISHPRDYFIVGFNKVTKDYEMPWLSTDVSKKYKKSGLDINEFLLDYPTFEEQSLEKKPNIEQLLNDGNVGLDCRYLNFAPQCQGWMQVTQNGGYGSFLILWSNVWKLSTSATIPYFTGQYSKTKRGFGFVTIGANVDEFHSAANETKANVNKILDEQTSQMQEIVQANKFQVNTFITKLINELTIVTFLMILIVVVIALMLSRYISNKIEKLLLGTRKFSNNELEYRIKVSSSDEIGKLEESFNSMAEKISGLIKKEKELNENLEQKVVHAIEEQREQEKLLIAQSRLASMGEMIGNIAHQWRQPLNALGLVLQNIQFTHEEGLLDEEYMNRSLKKANTLTSNMSQTIDDFRNFFKPSKFKEAFDIKTSVLESVELVSSTFKYFDIKIVLDLYEEELLVEGYPNEFSQVLVNILNNAKDAFQEVSDKKEKNIVVRSFKEEGFVTIELIDNATGIDEKIIDKLFDPYFSTKEEENGTGIGLYMTKMIIEKNMNGIIQVKNIGEGAIFTIKLPIKIVEEN